MLSFNTPCPICVWTIYEIIRKIAHHDGWSIEAPYSNSSCRKTKCSLIHTNTHTHTSCTRRREADTNTSHVIHFHCQSLLALGRFPAPQLHHCSYRCLSSRHRKPTCVFTCIHVTARVILWVLLVSNEAPGKLSRAGAHPKLPHKRAAFGNAAIVEQQANFVTVTTDGSSQMDIVQKGLLMAPLTSERS